MLKHIFDGQYGDALHFFYSTGVSSIFILQHANAFFLVKNNFAARKWKRKYCKVRIKESSYTDPRVIMS
jgi:hypothetical protein